MQIIFIYIDYGCFALGFSWTQGNICVSCESSENFNGTQIWWKVSSQAHKKGIRGHEVSPNLDKSSRSNIWHQETSAHYFFLISGCGGFYVLLICLIVFLMVSCSYCLLLSILREDFNHYSWLLRRNPLYKLLYWRLQPLKLFIAS